MFSNPVFDCYAAALVNEQNCNSKKLEIGNQTNAFIFFLSNKLFGILLLFSNFLLISRNVSFLLDGLPKQVLAGCRKEVREIHF